MSEPQPVACSLAAGDLRERQLAWRQLLAGGRVTRERIPGGLRLTARAESAPALLELVDLERECCAWIGFEVAGPVVTLTAESAEGRAALDGMFLPG